MFKRKEMFKIFFIGKTFFGKGLEGNVFVDNAPLGKIHYHELKNCKVDYEKIDEALLDFLPTKKQWDYDTLVQTDFENLEVSNVSDTNVPIKYLKVKKRKKDTYKWEEVFVFDFNKTIQTYQFSDRLIESLVDYEYAIQPVAVNGIVGNEKIQEVETDFEGLWIVNKDLEQHQFDMGINDNIQLGSINRVKQSAVHETIGGKYPVVVSNSSGGYRKTTFKCALVDKEFSGQDILDRKAQKKYREKIEDFLGDGKPKIIKHSEGLYLLAKIPEGSINIIPFNDLQGMIAEVEFEIIEIGDANDTDKLKELGFVPETNRNTHEIVPRT